MNRERQEGNMKATLKKQIGRPKVPKKKHQIRYSPENQPGNGKSPLFKGKTSSNAWFSVVMLVFRGCSPQRKTDLSQISSDSF